MQFPQLRAFKGSDRIIRVVGHRGARGVLPENTLEGFAFTLSTGVTLLEFDVAITRDGVPVITHNNHLTPAIVRDKSGRWLCGEALKVSDLNFADLCQFDVGGLDGTSDYGKRFPDQSFLYDIRIPRLMDLLDLVNQPEHHGVHLMLEIKSDLDTAASDTHRRDVVAAVLADVRSASVTGRTILHSFDWALLEECRRQAPEIPTSYLSQLPDFEDEVGEDSCRLVGPDFQDGVDAIPDMVHEAGGQLWCPRHFDITPDSLARAKELGLCVAVWTVNELPEIARMVSLGVDAIVSDYPGRVQRYLLEHDLHWTDERVLAGYV